MSTELIDGIYIASNRCFKDLSVCQRVTYCNGAQIAWLTIGSGIDIAKGDFEFLSHYDILAGPFNVEELIALKPFAGQTNEKGA